MRAQRAPACVGLCARLDRVGAAAPAPGLYKNYAAYAANLSAAIREMLGPASLVELTTTADGSGLGAALLAAVAGGAGAAP